MTIREGFFKVKANIQGNSKNYSVTTICVKFSIYKGAVNNFSSFSTVPKCKQKKKTLIVKLKALPPTPFKNVK